jgi:hypothetical protein
MTQLTDKQHDYLARVGDLYARRRAVKNEALKELDAIIASRTERINETLYEAVRDAVNSGVPKRRIGIAIGTSAPQTYNQLIVDALAVAEVEEEEVEATVDMGDDYTPHFRIETPDPNTRIVKLDNYPLHGDVVSGEVEFAKDANTFEWFVVGDTGLDFAVERALFGTDVDAYLYLAFENGGED